MNKKEELSSRERNSNHNKNKVKRDLSPINLQFLDNKKNNENLNYFKSGIIFLTF